MSSGIEIILAPIYGIFVGIGELVKLTGRGVAALARMTKEQIEAEIEKAHQKKFEDWKEHEPAWAIEERQRIVSALDLEYARLLKAKEECEDLLKVTSKKHTAAGHTYALDKEKEKVQAELKSINEDIDKLLAAKSKYQIAMDKYETNIKTAKKYEDMASRPVCRYQPGLLNEHSVNKLSKRIEKLDKQLEEFCKTVNDFSEKVKNSHHNDFLVRLSNKLDKLDPTKEDALSEIREFISEIKREIMSLEEKLLDASLTKEAREAASEEMRTLQDLLDSLSPIETLLVKYQVMDAEAEERAASIYNECLQEIDEINRMEYVPESLKAEVEDQKRKLFVMAKELSRDNAVAVLTNIKTVLGEIKKDAEASLDRYQRFTEAKEHYRELHTKYPQKEIKRIMGDKYVDPDSYKYVDSEKIEGVIRMLETTNKILEENLQKAVVQGIVDYFVDRVGEKIVSKKKLANGDYEITYTRKDEKNVIYVITVSESGETKIAPKGVKLHDGRVLTTKEQLEKPTSDCAWSKHVREDFEEIELEKTLIVDVPKEAAKHIFEEENFYQFDNEEEARRFLKKNGWSEEAINQVLAKDDSSSEENEEESTSESAISEAIAIDPHK